MENSLPVFGVSSSFSAKIVVDKFIIFMYDSGESINGGFCMGYTMLHRQPEIRPYEEYSLEGAAWKFIREYCEKLGFDSQKAGEEDSGNYTGTSLKGNQIPYNMQKDIDRLCLENAADRFMRSGKKEDAFDVYFCYLEMFTGDYEKTRRMIELLSEFEANGSGLLMKHRDHYSHSVYVFVLGLAVFASNSVYRDAYKTYYGIQKDCEAAHHYLEYWGLASLFHDIGYPFELPFEQVASYFEVNGDKRAKRPYVAYHGLESFVQIDETAAVRLSELYDGRVFHTTDELFAYVLAQKLSGIYDFSEEQMLTFLKEKPTKPDKFNHFMDHAYFSATVLFKKLFCEMGCRICREHMDALTAVLMHNSLYKFSIARYKSSENIPFQVKLHPLAYMLMLCDELQCWDRTAYGRNSKKELHPMGCSFDLSGNSIKAVYLYDEKGIARIDHYKDAYIQYLIRNTGKKPELKAYSGMYEKDGDGICVFQKSIEQIVDLSEIRLHVDTGLGTNLYSRNRSSLSSSNFVNLYHFAVVLNGRWDSGAWKKAKNAGQEMQFIMNEDNRKKFADAFKNLSLEYKLSNINQAKAFARYMDKIDCFYTDKAVDFELLEHFTEEELVKIGVLEHQRWLQEHYDMGWEFGAPDKSKRELVRQHVDLIPDRRAGSGPVSYEEAEKNYRRLDKEEQDKDTEPMECMLAMLDMFDGLKIYRLR